ncbi:hypothetical protein L7F22_022246 [Adiantum nelumboides]|nr:hypothetical protein [Adiantum nelumboides]
MVRLLGYNSQAALEEECPREISKTPSPMGENGWLIRFFDSSFFCEWIAVSYLYKHDHQGVRDYLCNKMYMLPLSGIEGYLFQLCYMMVYKTSAALEKFMMDGCSKSLKIALKVHWFLQAEAEESDDAKELNRLLEKCQLAALMGDWPPLVRPKKIETSPGSRNRMLNKLLSSRRLLNIKSSPPLQKVLSPGGAPNSVIEEAYKSIRESITFRRKEESRPRSGEEEKVDRKTGILQLGDEEGFFKRLFRDKVDDREKKEDREKLEEEEKVLPNVDEEESPDFFLFRRFLRVHPEDDDKASAEATTLNNSESSPGTDGFFRRLFKDRNLEDDDKAVTEGTTLSSSESSPGTDGFFKRLFKDRNLEDSKVFSLRREDGISPSNLLKKLFKDKTDDVSSTTAEDQSKAGSDDLSGQQKEACGKESQLSVKNEPKEEKKAFDVDTRLIEAMNGCVLAEVDSRAAYEDSLQSCPDHRPSETSANTANGMSFVSVFQFLRRLSPAYCSLHCYGSLIVTC